MSTVVARWEFRIFASDLSLERRALGDPDPAPPREGREHYLLGPDQEQNWKLRAGVLDLKRLRELDARGLERWEPVAKLDLPAPSQAVLDILGPTAPPLPDPVDAEQLIQALSLAPRWQVVSLEKRRHAHRVEGCLAEWAELEWAGGRLESIGLEGEDAARLWQALERVGLAGRVNTSYVRALHGRARAEEES